MSSDTNHDERRTMLPVCDRCKSSDYLSVKDVQKPITYMKRFGSFQHPVSDPGYVKYQCQNCRFAGAFNIHQGDDMPEIPAAPTPQQLQDLGEYWDSEGGHHTRASKGLANE